MTPTVPEILRQATPFAYLTREARAAYLREYGMHVRDRDYRVGCDAFVVRADVDVGYAVDTLAQLLRGVIATLELLEVDQDIAQPHREVCAACAMLGKQAGGALAVIAAAICTVQAADRTPPGGA